MPTKLFLITPFIYLELFSISLLVYLFASNKKYWIYLPLILSFIAIIPLTFAFKVFHLGLGVTLISGVIIAYKFAQTFFKERRVSLSFSMQMLDALSTFLGITFRGYYEEHVVGRAIINFLEKKNLTFYGSGAWGFLIIKITLAFLILFILEKYYKEEDLYPLVLFFIAILGFVVGLRNAINLIFL